MTEVKYYVAEDGKKFEDMYECLEYERQKMLEKACDEFIFLDYHKKPIAIEEARTDNVEHIVIKTDRAAEVVGKWFDSDGCLDPFGGIYKDCVGTWVYGSILDRGDEWIKLELAVEQLQTLIAEINK